MCVYGLNDEQTTSYTKTLLNPYELAIDIPRARIAIFGYDARAYISGYRLEDALDCHTQWLLDDLVKMRAEPHSETRRPIIFIADDLGGLIVKRALITSHSAAVSDPETTSQTESIMLSTVGVVFLGSPTGEEALSSSHVKSLSDRLVELQQEEFNCLSKNLDVHNYASAPFLCAL